VGSLYVLPFYHNRGIGKKMVEYACLQAKERGVTTVIALSTQSYGFFSNVVGFEEATKDILPEARRGFTTTAAATPKSSSSPSPERRRRLH